MRLSGWNDVSAEVRRAYCHSTLFSVEGKCCSKASKRAVLRCCTYHSLAIAINNPRGVKATNDQLDAEKIAGVPKGAYFPLAYVYPKAKTQTRDLLGRRSFFVRQRARLIAHIENANSQYNECVR